MKKLLFLLILSLICLNVFGASITNYVIKTEVPLNQPLTIHGVYNSDVNAFVLCQFNLVDSNSGVFVDRLTDQYTFSDGSFYAEYTVHEPLFKRSFDYNAITTCGTISANTKFSVVQLESIAQPATQNFLFIFQRGNLDSIFIVGSLLILVIIVISFAYYAWKSGKKFGSG